MSSRRLFATTSKLIQAQSRSSKSVPPPTEDIPDVQTFLNKIGRNCSELTEMFGNNWNNLFTWNTQILKEKGISAQQRKYILRQVEKMRQNQPIIEWKEGKKSFFGGERNRRENIAKWRAEHRQ